MLPDNRMTMNHQYDYGHEMANVMSKDLRKASLLEYENGSFYEQGISHSEEACQKLLFCPHFSYVFILFFIEKDY